MKFFRSVFALVTTLCLLVNIVSAATDAPDGNNSSPAISLLPPSGTPEIVPLGGNVTDAETGDLAYAVQQYLNGQDHEDFSPLEFFLRKYPQSAYRAGVLVTLGELYYHYGYYSKALVDDQTAWALVKDLPIPDDPASQKLISGAGIRLAALDARLGRYQELKSVLTILDPLPKWGSDTSLYMQGLQSAAIMGYRPGTSYNCGPYALLNIAKSNPGLGAKTEVFTDARSKPEQGFTVAEVEQLAQDAGLQYVAARRSGNAAIPLPAVAHWKAGHYAAVLEEKDGRYLVKDPTFGTDFWMSAKALAAESSGVFIVPLGADGKLPAGWQLANNDDRGLSGRGAGLAIYIYDIPENTVPCSSLTPMAVVGYNLFEAQAYVTDAPVQYTPAYGPPVMFQLSYYANEEGGQVPANVTTIGNLSLAHWSMNYLSLVREPDTANGTVTLLNADGTMQTYTYYTGYNSTTGTYTGNGSINIVTGAVMEQQGSGNTTSYIQHFPDGSSATYGSTTTISYRIAGTPSSYYLLQAITDPQNNSLTLSYDSYKRLTKVTDALGQNSTVDYITTNVTINGTPTGNITSNSYYIANISDPFGHTATLNYSSGLLANITDPISIVSAFTYNGSNITTVSTPYGNTTLTATYTNLTSIFGANETQFFDQTILIKDPNGDYQRITFGNPLYDITGNVELGGSLSLYFGKHAMSEIATQLGGGGNLSSNDWLEQNDSTYATAFIYYATKYNWYNNVATVVGVPANITEPIDWYGTSKYTELTYNADSNSLPISAEVTSANINGDAEYDYTYNSLGKVLTATDPLSRVTTYTYDTNNIDLTKIKQGNDTIAQFSYNTYHQPTTVIDAANVTTNLSYNGTNHLLTEVDRAVTNGTAAETTYYNWGFTGNVPANLTVKRSGGGITNATLASYTYANSTVQSATDIHGITANFTYDALQRVTNATYSDNTTAFWNYTNTTINGTAVLHSLSLGASGHSFFDPIANATVNQNTTITYNPDGQPLVVTDPMGNTTTYDWCGCGALNSITFGGQTTEFTYNIMGNVLTKNITVGGNTSTYSYGYGNFDQLASVTLPNDQPYETKGIFYYKDGTVSDIIYSGNFTDVNFTYDSNYLRVTAMSDAIGTTSYTYGNVGSVGALQVATVSGPYANATLKYTYDSLGRKTARAVMSDDLGTTYQSETYTYDGLDRVTALAVAGNTGNLGNFTNITYSGNTSDLMGMAYPNGMNVALGYFNASLGSYLANITNNAANTSLISQHAYTHRGDGSVSTWQQTYPWNSVISANVVLMANATPPQQQMTAYSYDADNWLTEAKFGEPSGNVTSPVEAVWQDHTYTYDSAGNRLTNSVSSWATAANTANLTGNFDTTSTISGNFNTDNSLTQQTRSGRVEVAGTVDKPAQVTADELPTRQWALPTGRQFAWESGLPLTLGNATTANVKVRATDAVPNTATNIWTVGTGNVAANFTYDANGDRLTRVNDPGSAIATTANYTWDSIGELLSVQQGNNTISFTYDGLGRRVGISANIGGNETDEYYIWDGDQIVQKRVGGSDSGNITEKFYDYGYQTVSGNSSTNYFYTKDHLGSIREVVANNGNTVEGRFVYGPWGETTYLDYSGGNVSQPDFGYAGYFQSKWLPELDFTVNRIYDPNTASWLSRDPLGEMGSLNLYGYAGNNPVNNTDPSGLLFVAGNSHPNTNRPWSSTDTAITLGLGAAPVAVYLAAEYLPFLGLGAAATAQADPELPDQISQIAQYQPGVVTTASNMLTGLLNGDPNGVSSELNQLAASGDCGKTAVIQISSFAMKAMENPNLSSQQIALLQRLNQLANLALNNAGRH